MTREEAVALLERYSNYDGMGIPNLAGCKEAMKVAVESLKEAYPELKDSEDERIRAVILKLVLGMRDEIFTAADKLVTKPKVLAWLEKQKEQNLIMANSPQLKEQKPVKHPKMVEMLREHLENTPKEQLDVEFEELKNWNDVGPTVEEFFHGKPIEWNEKDEKMRACAISLLQISRDSGMAINPGFGKPVRAINKCIDWLKSLRPSWKPSEVCYGVKGDPDPAGVWKPSEEQMGALAYAIQVLAPRAAKASKELENLREQLKKL